MPRFLQLGPREKCKNEPSFFPSFLSQSANQLPEYQHHLPIGPNTPEARLLTARPYRQDVQCSAVQCIADRRPARRHDRRFGTHMGPQADAVRRYLGAIPRLSPSDCRQHVGRADALTPCAHGGACRSLAVNVCLLATQPASSQRPRISPYYVLSYHSAFTPRSSPSET